MSTLIQSSMGRKIISLLLIFVASVSISYAIAPDVTQVITGTVVNENGSPLAGATIVVDGTNIAAGTNYNGEFSLELRSLDSRVLRVSFVGYTTLEVEVEKQSESRVDVALEVSQYAVEEVVVTGSRIERPLKETPVITRVISSERIAQVNPVDFASLLQYELPGIQFSYNSMSQLQEINFQGVGSEYIVFLIDGERIAGEGADQNIDFNRINVNDIDRIEVVRGAASTLYGSNALGGVINIITKSANRPFTADISARYAGDNGQTYSASVGTKQNRFSSYTTVGYRQRDSYTIEDTEGQTTTTIDADGAVSSSDASAYSMTILGYEAYDASQKFGYAFTDNLSASVKATYYNNTRALSEGEKNYDIYKDITVTPTVKYLIDANNQIDFAYTYDIYDKDQDYFEAGIVTTDYRNIIHIGRVNYSGKFNNHTLSAGVEYENEYLKHYMLADSSSATRSSISMYLQNDYKFSDKFNIVAGLRGDYETEYDLNLTPKVSAMYRPIEYLTIRANYAMGYRSPSLKELYQEYDMGGLGWFYLYGNADLTPERSTQYSLSGEYTNSGFNTSVTAYHNKFKDKIALQTTEDGLNYQYVNADNAKTTGVEFIARYKSNAGWSVMGSYSFIDDYEEVDGYNISSVRPHSATFNCTYVRKIGSVMGSVSLNGQWSSAMDVYTRDTDDDGNNYYYYNSYDNRTLCSVNLSAQLPRGINVGFMVDNLLNFKDSAYEYGTQTPQTGISYVLSLSINIADMFKL
ncbi:MAG: TonB-dependent receptor [Rikenellaceae bacterium]